MLSFLKKYMLVILLLCYVFCAIFKILDIFSSYSFSEYRNNKDKDIIQKEEGLWLREVYQRENDFYKGHIPREQVVGFIHFYVMEIRGLMFYFVIPFLFVIIIYLAMIANRLKNKL